MWEGERVLHKLLNSEDGRVIDELMEGAAGG